MKRTLTSVAAAALVLGAMAPAAFAASTANNAAKVVGTKAVVVDGTTLSNPYELTAVDSGNTTAYFGVHYFDQALTKAGFTSSWNGNTHTWAITAPGVDASKVKFDSTGSVGTGNTSITINGTLVKKINTFSHVDPADNKTQTTYFPVFYVNNLLSALGIGGSWDATQGLTVTSKLSASVAVTAADTITVTFNKPVDTTKASFDVKEGLGVVSTAPVTWNSSNTVATIKKSWGVFAADTYTVDVNGLGLDTTAYTLNIAAQKVSKIAFVGTTAVKASDNHSATFFYHVYDQYGTDITSTANLQSSASTGNGTLALDPTTGKGTITYDFTQTNAPGSVVVTLVDATSGTSASQTLNVAAAASIKSLTFGATKLATGVTHLYTGSATAGEVAFTAVDQYGNNVTDLTQLGNSLQLLSSDPNVHFTFVNDNNVPYINVDTSGLATAENVTLTAVNSATGLAVSTTLQVAKPSAPAAVSFGQLSTPVLADSDTAYMSINVTDQFGTPLTADQIVAAGFGSLDITATGGLQGQISLVADKNSSHYGQLKLTPNATGYSTIISTLGSSPVSTSVNVQATRELSNVVAAPTQYLIQGASQVAVPFTFKDQYGADFTPATDAALKYSVAVTDVSGDAGAIALDGTYAGTNTADLASIKVKSVAGKLGSAKVTVQVINATTNAVVSQASTTVTSVKNNVSGLTYSIASVPTLAGNQGSSYTAASPYAQELTLSAKDASGNTYAVNSSDIVSVTSSDTSVADVAQNAGAWYVFGKDVSNAGANTSNKTATVTVTLNTLDGVKTVSTTVTVSPAAPTTSAVRVVNAALAGATTDASGVTDANYVSSTNAALTTGVNLYVIAEDQYGVWNNVTSGTAVVNSTDKVPANDFTFASGTLTLSGGTNLPLNTPILVTIIVNGVSKQITVTATA